MSSDVVIRASGLAKCYALFDRPIDRLKQMFWRGRRKYYRDFWALREVDLEIHGGEVLGIVGRNGAGKSTLLQLVCGTLTPTAGSVEVRGRIAALLELGAGFNPEFSGRENVHLAAAVLGLTPPEIDARFEEIIEFSGIRDFIDQPVKTYSSGMFVRLAFSIATSVNPDILVIDEALSVGDGQFARKSFNRIMALKEAGKTILFCSHSLYQIEMLCDRVLWLDAGSIRRYDAPAEVLRAYATFLDAQDSAPATTAPTTHGRGRILGVDIRVDGQPDKIARSGESTVTLGIDFSLPAGEVPSLAVGFFTADGRCVSTSGTMNDGLRDLPLIDGRGRVTAVFEHFPLLRGEYTVGVWLLCERALFTHEAAERVGRIVVEQTGVAQGLVELPHRWEYAP